MTTGILGTAISGLVAFQRSLETTSHNISNVNTEGYSRQRVELGTSSPRYTGHGYVGTGVNVANISRSYDQFISGQLRSSTSAFGEVDSYNNYASQVDNLLADPSTGMQPAIDGFFNSVNDVANDPSSINARNVMLVEAESLTNRFGTIALRFEELRDQVNFDLNSMTDSISSYAKEIASLNVRIASDLGRANGQQQPNDLLDQRDMTLNKLAELINVSVIPQSNGMVTVVMGKGQPLVVDAQAATIGTQVNEIDPTKLDITLTALSNGTPQLISSQLAGGALTGAIRFRDEVLDPAQQQLGAVAAAVAMDFNAIHEGAGGGYDLDGVLGLEFFRFNGVEVPALAVSTNAGAAAVTSTFNNINTNPGGASSADLNTSDYLLQYDGANYTLTNMTDNTSIPLTAAGGGPFTLTPTIATDRLPGITLQIDVVPAANDRFLIRPTYQAAENLEVNITDPRNIAAATNLATDGVTILAGGRPGDNRNALLLAELSNNTGMFGSTNTFQEAYGQIVSKVGGLTHAAEISATAQEALLDRANEARENLSGVNLDEEAANLIKFQQSYQAAAQTISVASSLFDTLIGAVR